MRWVEVTADRIVSRGALSLALVLSFAAAGRGQGLTIDREGALMLDMNVQEEGPHVSSFAPGSSGVLWTHRLTHPDRVDGIRIHIEIRSAPSAGTWRLRIIDAVGTVVESIESESRLVRAGAFWTDVIRGRSAVVELSSDGPVDGLKIAVDRYAYRITPSVPQGITGDRADFLPIPRAPPLVQGWAGAIAKIRFMIPSGQTSCTGFLATADLLFTNEHCISDEQTLLSATVEFGYDRYGAAPELFDALTREAFSVELDYALLRLARPAVAWGTLEIAAARATDGQSLALIQHPWGDPKQVSLVDCVVNGVLRAGVQGVLEDFGHECDTAVGSSGSPVLDAQTGAVVGLHHWGYLDSDSDPVNQAVHIASILAHLRTVNPPVFQEISGNGSP